MNICATVPVFSCCLLAGCRVGPNYTRPPVPVPAAYKEPPPEAFKESERMENLPPRRGSAARQLVGDLRRFSVECARGTGHGWQPGFEDGGSAISPGTHHGPL